MKRFEIKYNNISEIRHGSPYNLAEIKIEGDNNIGLEKNNDWQDKHSWSRDGKHLAQVKWNFKNSDPGFVIYLYNIATGENFITSRFEGCCHKIKLLNDLTCMIESFKLISEIPKQYGVIKLIEKLK